MSPQPSFAIARSAWIAIGLLLATAGSAAAQVSQPDGTPMPQPANPNEISCCVVNRGFPAAADTLAGLFMYHQINGVAGGDTALDPINDAHTTPGTFAPQCGLSGTIVLHGGGCHNALGWYNATDPATVPTAIYPIVPADLTKAPPNGISCENSSNNPPTPLTDFCPLATRMTTQGYTWADPLPDFAADIRNDPHWAGGPVGFALIGNTDNGNLCPQTKYSQAEINDHSPAGPPTNGAPWVTTLIYQSIADPNGYYIAFEDQPTCPASWRGCNPGSTTQALMAPNGNDGDFNDFVFYVSGIDCQGGGQACPTNMPGICANGTTQCSNGGTTFICQPNIQPRTEVCNGLDDDCDGVVDNPDAPGLCPSGEVCNQGVCVFPCSTGEFPCLPPGQCDQSDGLCKDPLCMGVTCNSDQICVRGQCIGGCDNVTCPPGQTCRIGTCVDPCQGITCGSGQVCENGACLGTCGCRNCPTGKVCSTQGPMAGTCIDKGCDTTSCNPPQTVCVNGQCVDGCAGVQCPAGQACSGGICSEVDGGIVGGTPGNQPDAGTPISGTGGSPPTSGTGGTVGSGASGGATGSGGGSAPHESGVTTCSCDTTTGPGAGGLALMLAGLAVALVRRRQAARPKR